MNEPKDHDGPWVNTKKIRLRRDAAPRNPAEKASTTSASTPKRHAEAPEKEPLPPTEYPKLWTDQELKELSTIHSRIRGPHPDFDRQWAGHFDTVDIAARNQPRTPVLRVLDAYGRAQELLEAVRTELPGKFDFTPIDPPPFTTKGSDLKGAITMGEASHNALEAFIKVKTIEFARVHSSLQPPTR